MSAIETLLKTGRMFCAGPKSPVRRHAVALAAVFALSSIVSVLPVPTQAAGAAPASESTMAVPAAPSKGVSLVQAWNGGWGMDRLEFARVAHQQGHTPGTTALAAWLLERLDGPMLLPKNGAVDESIRAGLVVRQGLKQELRAALGSPSQIVAFAQSLPKRMKAASAEHRLALGDRADLAAFEATVGFTEDEEHALPGWLEWAKASPEEGLTWISLGEMWNEERHALQVNAQGEQGLSWEAAQQRLQAAVETTGLAQLRISPALVDSPERADALATRLVGIQNVLNERLGVSGPLLGLAGRVKLELSQPTQLDTHGQVVEAARGVVMRSTLAALPHENYHALVAVMAQHNDAATVKMMSDTMLKLRTVATPEELQEIRGETRQQFERYMEGKKFAADTRQQLRQAKDQDPEWERLYALLVDKEGLDEEDARTALMMAMAVSPAYESQHGSNPRWASLRRVVGVYLQSSQDLQVAMSGTYLSNDEEILASAYAAQVPDEWTQPNGIRLGILDTPGPQEAKIQRQMWREFSAQAQPFWQAQPMGVEQWRQQRAEARPSAAPSAPRASKMGR